MHTDKTYHYVNNKMRKIYFLRNLIQLFLVVEFRRDSLQYCSDSSFAFETYLQHLIVKKSQ